MNEAETTQTRCTRCGRPLHAAKSIAAGRGPTCARKVRAAARTKALADYKPAQQAKALELIEQGGMVAIRGRHVFAAVSSDGTRTYKAAPQACTCPAGARGTRCYHRAAAAVLSLAA